MTTWHVQVELNGRLDDDQMEAVGECVPMSTFLEDGFVELRFDLEAEEPDTAVIRAREHFASLEPVQALRAAGLLTGPHRFTVMDQLAHARSLTLVGIAEGAALMGITPRWFRELRRDDPDFPEPAVTISRAELFEAAAITAYDKRRVRGEPGRPRKA